MSTERQMEVRIITLEPMRFASVYGFGAEPELSALEKLAAWAKPRGFLNTPGEHRIFGFNNPDPSHGSPNYGYEFWIAVGQEVEAEGEVRIQQFNGGLYAVTRCRGVETISDTWMRFYRWVQDSRYGIGSHQWLEEHIGRFPAQLEEMVLDLHMPIIE